MRCSLEATSDICPVRTAVAANHRRGGCNALNVRYFGSHLRVAFDERFCSVRESDKKLPFVDSINGVDDTIPVPYMGGQDR